MCVLITTFFVRDIYHAL